VKGTEQLVQQGYLDPGNSEKLSPERFGKDYGLMKLGSTSLGVLSQWYDLNLDEAESFIPTIWKKPSDLATCRPDVLVVKGKSVYGVLENKTLEEVKTSRKRVAALEQLQVYMLATKARIGVLDDTKSRVWLHNLDSNRKNLIKQISDAEGQLLIEFSSQNFSRVLTRIDSNSDTISEPEKLDPSQVARAVWQSVWIATRENAERCFQTFVELFTYKMLSDCKLLPENMRIAALMGDPRAFEEKTGVSVIGFYLNQVRPHIKEHLFPVLSAPDNTDGITEHVGKYVSTKNILTNSGGARFSNSATSVIDGHAFQKDQDSHNDEFVNILRKLGQLHGVRSLDPGFKSRVYEQFLRRDPNITKASGKYFTPRNVVRAIVEMARVSNLQEGSIICDPACGVGGFITESILAIGKAGIKPYREKRTGEIETKYKFVGLDCEYDVICLAKSNFLLHTIEFFTELSEEGRENYQNLLADTFVLCHKDSQLGSLAHPVDGKLDLVMANPPYIVSGTGSHTRKIGKSAFLSSWYTAGGSGLESRFLNWIINSLKGGGKAFVILPKAMFARTEKTLKEFILRNCFIDSLVYLPSGTFYTTSIETCILGLTKKVDLAQKQEAPVFTYLVSEIGETRDVKREPTKNDLNDMNLEYLHFLNNRMEFKTQNSQCKVIPFSEFEPQARWDMDFMWSIEEKREIGIIDRQVVPVDELIVRFQDVANALLQSQEILRRSQKHTNAFKNVSLSEKTLFLIHRGNRVTKKEVSSHPGEVIVIASGRHKDSYFGRISEAYLRQKFEKETSTDVPGYFLERKKVISVGATGSVGVVHIRDEERWFLHDDALAVEVVSPDIDVAYFRFALQEAIATAQFGYGAKLYQERLNSLSVRLPIDKRGRFDIQTQKKLSEIYFQREAIQLNVFNTVRGLVGTDVGE
jgi:type I restriction enzyme M protein